MLAAPHIKYQEGYKYVLAQDYVCHTDVTGHVVDDQFYLLHADGVLVIRAGYAWDGASGPAFDTKTILRASLVHDVFYQMMRLGQLPHACFHPANAELHKICLQDGMWRVRAWWVFNAVEDFGSAFAAVQPDRILTAP